MHAPSLTNENAAVYAATERVDLPITGDPAAPIAGSAGGS